MTPALKSWLIAFAVTQAIKVPLYLRVTHRRWLAAFGAACVTHPIIWFVFPRFWPAGHWETLYACTVLFGIAIEAAWLASWGVQRPLEHSAAANVVAFCAWLVLHYFRAA